MGNGTNFWSMLAADLGSHDNNDSLMDRLLIGSLKSPIGCTSIPSLGELLLMTSATATAEQCNHRTGTQNIHRTGRQLWGKDTKKLWGRITALIYSFSNGFLPFTRIFSLESSAGLQVKQGQTI